MAGYEQAPLGELLGDRGYIRGPFGSALLRRELSGHGIPVYEQQHAITGIREFRFFIDEKKLTELSRFTIKPDDLIVSCSGTIGRISIIQPNDPIGIISQALLILRPQTDRVLPRFLYYFLSTRKGQEALLQASHGSVQVNIAPRAVVEQIEVPTPNIQEQRAIIRILGALDDKIELNRRMNRTLEETAQAMFKSWFVDFDPVRAKAEGRRPAGMDAATAALFPSSFQDSELGEIPKGWKVGKVADLCQTQYGHTASACDDASGPRILRITDMNKEPWIEWSNVPYCRIDESLKPRYALKIGDVLVSRMADPGKAAIIEEEVDAVFASYLIRLQIPRSRSYQLFYFLRSSQYLDYAEGATSGTVQANMNANVITAADMTIPPDAVAQAFQVGVEPLRSGITHNLKENRTLANIRDSLLPQLLSGELRVKEAEKTLEIAS